MTQSSLFILLEEIEEFALMICLYSAVVVFIKALILTYDFVSMRTTIHFERRRAHCSD